MRRGSAPVSLLALAALWSASGCNNTTEASTTAESRLPTSAETTAQAEPAPGRVGDPADWCRGCGVPESMCTVCNPELIPQFQEAGDWCAEHGFPESVCPQCNPMLPPGSTAPTPTDESSIPAGTLIRFRSPDIEAMAGIETVPAVDAALGVGVECMARIEFDRNRLSDIRSPIPGIVREVAVDLGDAVAEGDALFVLESAHVGDLQARRQAARERVDVAETQLERLEALRADSIASTRDVEQARQELQLAEADLDSIDQSLRLSGASRGSRSGSFSVTSPIAGTIIDRPAVLGTFAGESDSLATVADTTRMWALLEVPEWDAATVRLDQEAELEVDGIADRTFTGRITWIAAAVDPRTRTVAVRVEVENPDGLLRANQFARARIDVAAPERSAAVPVDAVQRVEAESVVFVRTGPGVYEPRVVTTGRSDGEQVQVTGLQVGDPVVTTGAYLLRTELSRDSIGAGCCEVGPMGGH